MGGRVVAGLGAAGQVLVPAIAVAAETSPTGAPPLDAGSILQVILGLVAVLLFIGGVAWLLRHVLRFQPTVGGQLRILGGLSMGPRERVVLVKVGESQLLLGVAPGRLQTLHVLDRPLVESVAEEPDPPGFAAQLARAIRRSQRPRRDV